MELIKYVREIDQKTYIHICFLSKIGSYITFTSNNPIPAPIVSPIPKNTITILEAISLSCCSTILK